MRCSLVPQRLVSRLTSDTSISVSSHSSLPAVFRVMVRSTSNLRVEDEKAQLIIDHLWSSD